MKIQRLFNFFALFLIILGPRLIIAPFNFRSAVVSILAFASIINWISCKNRLRGEVFLVKCLLISFVVAILSLLRSSNAQLDWPIVFSVLQGILAVLASSCLLQSYRSLLGIRFFTAYYNDLFLIIILNCSVVNLSFFFPPFGRALSSIFLYSDKQLKWQSLDTSPFFRYSGFAEVGFANLSVLSVLLILIAIVFRDRIKRINSISRLLLMVLVVYCYLSIILISRSGLFIVPLVFASVFFILLLKRSMVLRGLFRLPKLFLMYFSAIFISVTVAVVAFPSIINNLIANLSETSRFAWLFELQAEYNTLSAIESMLVFPKTLPILFFGSGDYGLTQYSHFFSDIGFVYLVNGAGLIGTPLLLLGFLAPVFDIATNRMRLPDFRYYLVCFYFSILILNFKDFYFYNLGGIFFVYVSIYLSAYMLQDIELAEKIHRDQSE